MRAVPRPAWNRICRKVDHGFKGGKGKRLSGIDHIYALLVPTAGLKPCAKACKAAGKDVLLIERFDHIRYGDGWSRKCMVSALTMFGISFFCALNQNATKFEEIYERATDGI